MSFTNVQILTGKIGFDLYDVFKIAFIAYMSTAVY